MYVSMIFSLTAFSQSEYNYKAKFEGVSDAAKAAPVITSLKMVFKTPATFNEATNQIEFNSKMSISQTVFNNMMSGEGFLVESFERHEAQAAAPVEVKKVAVDSSTKSATATSVVKKEIPKSGTPPKTGK